MAGHIKRRTIASNLDKIGEQTLLEKVASGLTMAALARELRISNLSLYHWIKKDPERKQRFDEARALAADQWADECLDIADQTDNLNAKPASGWPALPILTSISPHPHKPKSTST